MKLSADDKKFLELYSDSIYEKPSVTVDSVIFRLMDEETINYRKLPKKNLQVYLQKREYSPFKNCYSIVGTFIDLKTELAHTMKLCAKKKVGIENFYYEQLYTFGDKTRDPRTRVLSVSYMLLTNKKESLHSGNWFDVDVSLSSSTQDKTESGFVATQTYQIVLSNETEKLTNLIKLTISKNGLEETKSLEILESDLAFDHIKIIYYALERLKNKLEYTDIIFNLLPSKFTLTELKRSYEVILNNQLLDANFRRKISNMVTPINEFTSNEGHRPSQLFVHNPDWKLNNID